MKKRTLFLILFLAGAIGARIFMQGPTAANDGLQRTADGVIIRPHASPRPSPSPGVKVKTPSPRIEVRTDSPVVTPVPPSATLSRVSPTPKPIALTSTPSPMPAATPLQKELKHCPTNSTTRLLIGLTGPAAQRLWVQTVERCDLESYRVRRGDTLSSISRRIFGDDRYWPKIWAQNPNIEQPYEIKESQLIVFERPDDGSASDSVNWYEVQKEDEGSSLDDLAARLGNRDWGPELAKQNPSLKDTRRLHRGTQIRIDTNLLPDGPR